MFEHQVEVEAEARWIFRFDVGPSNDELTCPIDPDLAISDQVDHVDRGLAFYEHHGSIPTEFRTALVNNLKAGSSCRARRRSAMQYGEERAAVPRQDAGAEAPGAVA